MFHVQLGFLSYFKELIYLPSIVHYIFVILLVVSIVLAKSDEQPKIHDLPHIEEKVLWKELTVIPMIFFYKELSAEGKNPGNCCKPILLTAAVQSSLG